MTRKLFQVLFVQLILILWCTFARKIGRSVKLTHRDKLMIVNYHNDIRRLIYASDMQTLSWDTEAADKAREWGRNCIFNRPWDDHYGENLYKAYFTKATRSREVMMDALKDWENEKQNLFSWHVKCTESETCNYAQLVSATADSVGCALIKCPKMIESKSTIDYNMHYFLCFYSPRIELDVQPFTYGKKCSACPKGYNCKRKMCRRPKWKKIVHQDERKNKIPLKTFEAPTANIVLREKNGQVIRPYRNSSYTQSNVLIPIPPEALTGREPSEQSFNSDSKKKTTSSNRVKRQVRRRNPSYEEWYRRERLRQERARAAQQYQIEERRRQRQQQEEYRRQQRRPASSRQQRRPASSPRRQRQADPGSITSEEINYLTSAHNLLRGNGIQQLRWSRYLERWAKYVIRCVVEYPGPITTYTNFGKNSNGGNIYNIVYDWGNEGYNVNQRLRYGCRTPSDREKCNHNVIIRNEFLREFACASRNCSNDMRQLTCIYR